MISIYYTDVLNAQTTDDDDVAEIHRSLIRDIFSLRIKNNKSSYTDIILPYILYITTYLPNIPNYNVSKKNQIETHYAIIIIQLYSYTIIIVKIMYK